MPYAWQQRHRPVSDIPRFNATFEAAAASAKTSPSNWHRYSANGPTPAARCRRLPPASPPAAAGAPRPWPHSPAAWRRPRAPQRGSGDLCPGTVPKGGLPKMEMGFKAQRCRGKRHPLQIPPHTTCTATMSNKPHLQVLGPLGMAMPASGPACMWLSPVSSSATIMPRAPPTSATRSATGCSSNRAAQARAGPWYTSIPRVCVATSRLSSFSLTPPPTSLPALPVLRGPLPPPSPGAEAAAGYGQQQAGWYSRRRCSSSSPVRAATTNSDRSQRTSSSCRTGGGPPPPNKPLPPPMTPPPPPPPKAGADRSRLLVGGVAAVLLAPLSATCSRQMSTAASPSTARHSACTRFAPPLCAPALDGSPSSDPACSLRRRLC
jgi:hypothetical protein